VATIGVNYIYFAWIIQTEAIIVGRDAFSLHGVIKMLDVNGVTICGPDITKKEDH